MKETFPIFAELGPTLMKKRIIWTNFHQNNIGLNKLFKMHICDTLIVKIQYISYILYIVKKIATFAISPCKASAVSPQPLRAGLLITASTNNVFIDRQTKIMMIQLYFDDIFYGKIGCRCY